MSGQYLMPKRGRHRFTVSSQKCHINGLAFKIKESKSGFLAQGL